MATGGGGRCKKWQTLGGGLLVAFLAISALYLTMHRQTEVALLGDSKNSSAVEVTTGSVFFNLKPLETLCSSAGQADEMVQTDLIGMGHVTTEAEWRLLNTSLQCGRTKMQLEVEGPGSPEFELYFGDSCTLPLSQVPQMCGFLADQNNTSLTLIVDYEGCNVKQENGSFVVFLSWRKTAIKLACAVLPSPDSRVPSTSPEPLQPFFKATLPPKQWPLRRIKRFVKNPYGHYHLYPKYHYRPYVPCFYVSQFPTTTEPPTTTTTTTTTSPMLNPVVWRKLLNRYIARDQNTRPQNTIEEHAQPIPEDWRHLQKMAQQAIFQNYMPNALGYHPHVYPLSNVLSKGPLRNPKPCRRRWFDASCRDSNEPIRKTLNFPLSSWPRKNNLNDWKPVYRMNHKSNVIWDQLPWFQN